MDSGQRHTFLDCHFLYLDVRLCWSHPPWIYKDELIWVQELDSEFKGDNSTMLYELED